MKTLLYVTLTIMAILGVFILIVGLNQLELMVMLVGLHMVMFVAIYFLGEIGWYD